MTLRSEELDALAILLDEALDLTGDARAVWLERLEGGDAQWRSLLRTLLARHAGGGVAGILDTLPKFAGAADVPEAHGPSWPFTEGMIVGPYRLNREIGRGGMSVVWSASRADGQLKRLVALKLPFVPLHQGVFAKRFERERDILAGLTHPRIARVYDAGISAAGQPFLAMEFVQGTPLLEHCDGLKLDLRARLSLFEQVLSAVQYAHSHLVVHRDLKPSNILVTSESRVVLLDFGIAKLLNDGAARETEATLFGGRAMTPDYASPEQISGAALGTTSDIYSLGVVLYELLAGARPYRLERDSRGALEEAILSLDPVPPSRMCTPEAAHLRGTSVHSLTRMVRGDLDTIVMKALQKRPEGRYPTADALGQELQRYLIGEPIQAQASRPWYRARKFLARNVLPSALAGGLFVALVAGFGAALWEAHTARLEARRAESVKHFLVRIFSQNDPEQARGQDITAGEILARGADGLDKELRDEPQTLAELHHAISDIYISLGDDVDGRKHADRAIALLEKSGRQDSPDYVESLSLRAQALGEEEDWGRARTAYQDMLHAAHAVVGHESRWDVIAIRGIAWAATEQGQLTEAKGLYLHALQVASRVAGERSQLYLETLSSSIQVDLDLGLLDEAERVAVKVVTLGPSIPGYMLTDQLVDRYQLATTLFRKRRYAESIAELTRLVPEMDRHIGARYDRTIKARGLLAQELAEIGDYKHALAEERINIESAANSRSSDPERFALQELTFAKILRGADRFEEGIARARSGLAYYDSKYSMPTWLRERGRWILGDLLVGAGNLQEGIATLSVALRNLHSLEGGSHSAGVADALLSLGNASRLEGDELTAIRDIDDACRLYDSLLGADSQSALRCRIYRGLVGPNEPRPRDLQSVYQNFESLRVRLAALLTPIHPLRAELDIIRSEYLSQLGERAEGVNLNAQAVRVYEDATGASPHIPIRLLH